MDFPPACFKVPPVEVNNSPAAVGRRVSAAFAAFRRKRQGNSRRRKADRGQQKIGPFQARDALSQATNQVGALPQTCPIVCPANTAGRRYRRNSNIAKTSSDFGGRAILEVVFEKAVCNNQGTSRPCKEGLGLAFRIFAPFSQAIIPFAQLLLQTTFESQI